jgi:serine/threonine-protein kinase
MGSDEAEVTALIANCPRCAAAAVREKPRHDVIVRSFAIDAREVDNEAFARWLAEVDGLELAQESLNDVEVAVAKTRGSWLAVVGSNTWSGLIEGSRGVGVAVQPGAERRAAVLMTWIAAQRFCRARGQRLPTEAEWELAARGRERRTYPWGEQVPRCDSVVFGRAPDPAMYGDDKHRALHPCIDSKAGPTNALVPPFDTTPEGVTALGSNVREWVLDAFDEAKPSYPSCSGACIDRAGDVSEGATFRVVRGGGFYDSLADLRSARRSYHEENRFELSIGFRCALPL